MSLAQHLTALQETAIGSFLSSMSSYTGIIIKGIGGFYYVALPDGRVVECSARGKLRRQKIKPMVGDNVSITIQDGCQDGGAIESISPRRTYFVRPPVANVDQVAIVIATASPLPDLFIIDKLTVQASIQGIEPIICVNKTDIAKGSDVIDIYKKAGYKVFPLSATKSEGVSDLGLVLGGKITAFAGNSGVGKSSILRELGFDAPVGSVSKIERGRHTTRHVELFPLQGGGFVIDTPGFSLLDLEDISENELASHFKDFTGLDNCTFRGCNHLGSSGCAVVKALEEGKISVSRYESYSKLYQTLQKQSR